MTTISLYINNSFVLWSTVCLVLQNNNSKYIETKCLQKYFYLGEIIVGGGWKSTAWKELHVRFEDFMTKTLSFSVIISYVILVVQAWPWWSQPVFKMLVFCWVVTWLRFKMLVFCWVVTWLRTILGYAPYDLYSAPSIVVVKKSN
jgi:hypothetical protein